MNTFMKIALILFVSVAAVSGCGNSGTQSGSNQESKAQQEAKTLDEWASTLRGQSLDDIIQIMGRPDSASEDDPVPGTGGLVRWTSIVYE